MRKRNGDDVTVSSMWRKTFVVTASAITASVLVLVGLGSSQVSLTLDESVDVESFNVFLESGWYVHPGVDLADPIRDSSSNVFVYGPVVHNIAHFLYELNRNEPSEVASLSTEEQQTRKLVLLSLLALAVASMTWSLVLATRRLWLGLLGGAVLAAIPVFSGHAMFNIKDFPPAAGLVMVISGVVSLTFPRDRRWLVRYSIGAALIGIGLLASVGTRPAFILIAGLLGVVGIVASALVGMRAGISLRSQWRTPLGIGIGFTLGYLLLVLQYPKLFTQPISLLSGSLNQTSGFPWGGFTLTAGELASNRPGVVYVIQWVGVQVPLIVTVFALVGAVWSVWLWVRLLSTSGSRLTENNEAALVGSILWMTVGFGIPLVVAVTDPVLYNGIRQLLFILPAFAFLSVIGLWFLMKSVKVRWGPRLTIGLAITFALLGVALPVLGQFRLFPYSYTGMNTLAVRDGIDGRWETDYWGVSTGELRRTGIEAKEQGLLPSWFFYPPDYCGDASYAGRWKESAGVDQSVIGGEASYFCQVRTWGRNTPPEGCEVGWAVKRPQLWRTSTMSLVAECPFSAGLLPEGGVSFAIESNDGVFTSPAEPFLLWGWQLSPDLGAFSISDSVGMGVRIPPSYRMRDLQLEMQLMADFPSEQPLTVMFRANGEPLGVVKFTDQIKEQLLTFRIPAQVVDRSGTDVLVIRIDQISGEEQPMFLFPQSLDLTTY